ncbi:hypothetical protein EB796_015534 [Bugula neritina]|uniref:Uncharacterized protein n=1 Tax=Bugula neritina TaxID=10212 RepID=A0A7J7JJD3_BUGNE|nr:hypothetical protein EB796_015534 [Bugula neritina]
MQCHRSAKQLCRDVCKLYATSTSAKSSTPKYQCHQKKTPQVDYIDSNSSETKDVAATSSLLLLPLKVDQGPVDDYILNI